MSTPTLSEFQQVRRAILQRQFSRMNDRQQQAVFHTDGALLLLAGAGSGKTTVLVNRVAQIIRYGRAYHAETMPDELSDEDRLTVNRARRVQRFLSQPFAVAEQFTGVKGQIIPIEETIRGFKMILDGETDRLPEQAFVNVGTIDDAVRKGEELLRRANA